MDETRKKSLSTAAVSLLFIDRIFEWVCRIAGANADLPGLFDNLQAAMSKLSGSVVFEVLRWTVVASILGCIWLVPLFQRRQKRTSPILYIGDAEQPSRTDRVLQSLQSHIVAIASGAAMLIVVTALVIAASGTNNRLGLTYQTLICGSLIQGEGTDREAMVVFVHDAKISNHTSHGMSLSFVLIVDAMSPKGELTGAAAQGKWSESLTEPQWKEIINIPPESTIVGNLYFEIHHMIPPRKAEEWSDIKRGQLRLIIDEKVSKKHVMSELSHYPSDPPRLHGPHVIP